MQSNIPNSPNKPAPCDPEMCRGRRSTKGSECAVPFLAAVRSQLTPTRWQGCGNYKSLLKQELPWHATKDHRHVSNCSLIHLKSARVFLLPCGAEGHSLSVTLGVSELHLTVRVLQGQEERAVQADTCPEEVVLFCSKAEVVLGFLQDFSKEGS